ncbi:tetratricopeptide repeat protein [Persicobacter diffluens]|uniref:HTH luxR-type domain-containing protein n=1 Tax=Persicobacter diffluens TaxID=981 RepID=A0AAN5AKR9_9BACT|nr:hypothetical protein PEDI_29910 [Persicobacter diffluens]
MSNFLSAFSYFIFCLSGLLFSFSPKAWCIIPNVDSTYQDSPADFFDIYKDQTTLNDSADRVISLIKMSDKDRYKGKYDLAFDHLWNALIIAEKQNYHNLRVTIHRNLGILYDIYNKDSLTQYHLRTSVNLAKTLFEGKKIKKSQFVSSYFSYANFWRNRGEYTLAMEYLDSCAWVHQNKRKMPYVMTDRGFCEMKLGNLAAAEKILLEAKTLLKQKNEPYIITNMFFLGDIKKELGELDSALFYYQKSLELMNAKSVHFELKPELLEKLSALYLAKGDLTKAYQYLEASKDSFVDLFSASSKHNQRLFSIKNKYLEEIANNKKLIENQQALIENKNRKLLTILVVFGFISLAAVAMYIVSRQKNKIHQLSLVRKMDNEKNNAVLELKSKELTAYTLKMIEKEDAIQNLLETVKKTSPKEFTTLKMKYAQGNDTSWEEFNRRFTEVNTKFYETLCKKHPNLSNTELKHCALIKLNFNSHEMSKILNISLQSVHTSRYRIRKKMELDSNSNLTSYIGAI